MAKFFKAFLPSITIIVILLLTLRQTPPELPTEKEPDHLRYPWNPNTEFNSSIRIDRPGLPPAPILPPGYRTETLTRLGTDLDFDLHTCPPGSIMTPRLSLIALMVMDPGQGVMLGRVAL